MNYLYEQQHSETQSSLSLQEPPFLSLDPSLSSERQQWRKMHVCLLSEILLAEEEGAKDLI